MLAVADRAGGEPVEQVHIATEQGEVFAIRHAGLTAVAVTERFALASLLFFDMRSILRDLAAEREARVDAPQARIASSSTASPDTPTRPPPTCAAAVSPVAPSPASTIPGGRAADHAVDSAGRR